MEPGIDPFKLLMDVDGKEGTRHGSSSKSLSSSL